MYNLTEKIRIFNNGGMWGLMALGLVVSVIMPGLDRWHKRFFTILFSVLLLLMNIYLAEILIYDQPNMENELKFAWFFGSLVVPIPMFMMTIYLLHCSGENYKSSPLFYVVSALCILYLVILGISQFTTKFYYVDQDGMFAYGSLYILSALPLNIVMLLNLAGVMQRRKKLTEKTYHAFLIYLVPLTAAMLIHTFVRNFMIVEFGITLFALSMFIIILRDQIEQFLRQQRDIAHQRASIMVLQMRPHFIYNTMTSIYYLCDQDAKKAQQVTMDFTNYLRKNFTAIASEETIPFSEELEHTRAYLAVEQAKFEDNLFIEYDTPHTQFRIPPLTLQPIVENSVKHGLDTDSEPLRILIQTRKTDFGSEITVEDNGSGFVPSNDDMPHIAISNIQQRLEMMCGGKLEIMSPDGGGTIVKITIRE